MMIGNQKFWRGLGNLINETPRKTIANYMMFRIVYNSLNFLSKNTFSQINKEYVYVSKHAHFND